MPCFNFKLGDRIYHILPSATSLHYPKGCSSEVPPCAEFSGTTTPLGLEGIFEPQIWLKMLRKITTKIIETSLMIRRNIGGNRHIISHHIT